MLLYNYAKFFQNQKIFDKAIEFYKKSFAIQPKNNLSMYKKYQDNLSKTGALQ